MAKLFSITVLLVTLAGLAQLGSGQASAGYGQDAISSAANYAQSIPSQVQNGMSSLQGQAQQQGGLLSGLLGGSGASGPFETIRQLPSRGLQMLNNMLSGVRSMLPGLGRNANNQSLNNQLGQLSPDRLLQNLPKNPVTDMAQGLLKPNGAVNGQGPLANLNQITNPIMEPLQQGRLPDINQMSQGATNALRGATENLMRLPTDLGNTINGAQGAQGGLGGLLTSLRPPATV